MNSLMDDIIGNVSRNVKNPRKTEEVTITVRVSIWECGGIDCNETGPGIPMTVTMQGVWGNKHVDYSTDVEYPPHGWSYVAGGTCPKCTEKYNKLFKKP